MKRNGKIDFLRFVFALMVVLAHINLDFWNWERTYFGGIFSLGKNMGVEFFFIVSGFLFAMSISSLNSESNGFDIAKEDFSFIWKKVKVILPYHLIACSIAFVFVLMRILIGDEGIEVLLDKIPSLFLLQTFQFPGSSESFLGAEWYISTMLFVMFVLFPFAVRFKSTFTGIIAPVIGLLLLSFNALTNAKLLGTDHNIRGFQDICLGIGCWYVWTLFKDRELKKKQKIIVTIVETSSYAMVTAYCFSTMSKKYQIYTALLLCVAVTLSFSGKGLLGETQYFDKEIFYRLGKWSIPIYLMQNPVRSGIQFVKEKGLLKASDSAYAMLDFILIIIAGIVVYYFYECIRKRFVRK